MLELFQESHIWTHKISHIRNPISDHHEAIETESECKSTIYLRIESSFSDHVWMDESSSHEFDPTRVFADLASDTITEWTREIYLYSRLNEREISRSHTDRNLFSEDIREHRCDRELQMTDTNSLIYNNPLNLIEGIVMGSVDIFIAKYSSRYNSPDWCIFIFHDQILHT